LLLSPGLCWKKKTLTSLVRN